MNKRLEALKKKLNIDNVFSMKELNNDKIYLFYNSLDMINYSISTDGIVTHIDTWIDKRPGDTDSFLTGSSISKRFEFKLENASIAFLEKKRKNNIIRNLYINEDKILKVDNINMYCVEIGNNEKIKIKKWGL